jgi:hypothetical protein
MSIPFEELVAHSTQAQLLGYEFADGVLTIHLEIDELDSPYLINIPTNYVYGEKVSFENHDLRNCRLDLLELSEILDVDGNIYVPNANFEVMISEMRSGVSLAYGSARRLNGVKSNQSSSHKVSEHKRPWDHSSLSGHSVLSGRAEPALLADQAWSWRLFLEG